jgi:hypothetical protein
MNDRAPSWKTKRRRDKPSPTTTHLMFCMIAYVTQWRAVEHLSLCLFETRKVKTERAPITIHSRTRSEPVQNLNSDWCALGCNEPGHNSHSFSLSLLAWDYFVCFFHILYIDWLKKALTLPRIFGLCTTFVPSTRFLHSKLVQNAFISIFISTCFVFEPFYSREVRQSPFR